QDAEYVREVLRLTDHCCDTLLDDVEYRTIVRRILALVAARDPRTFRRKGSTRSCAAALIWLVLRANCDLGRGRRPRVSWIWSWFGVSPCTDRGRALRSAAGLVPTVDGDDEYPYWDN